MSAALPPFRESPDVALARRIDAVCRQFENDWRAGRFPRIDDYLDSETGPGREALIAARRLNRSLRRLGGLAVPPEELPRLRRVLRRTRRLVDGLIETSWSAPGARTV